MSNNSSFTGLLKSIFRKSGENVGTVTVSNNSNERLEKLEKLPTLVSRNGNGSSHKNNSGNGFYQTAASLSKTTNDSLPVFDATSFSDDETSDLDSVEIMPNNLATVNTDLSLELNALATQMKNSLAVSDEIANEGHTLLGRAFNAPDELLDLVTAKLAVGYKILPVEVVDNKLFILFCDETLREMCENLLVNRLAIRKFNWKIEFIEVSETALLPIIETVYSTINSKILLQQQQLLSEKHDELVEHYNADVEKPTAMVFDHIAGLSDEQLSFRSMLSEAFCTVHYLRGTDLNIRIDYTYRDGQQVPYLVMECRVDGMVVVIKRQHMELPTYLKFCNVIKIIADLNTAKNKDKNTGYICGNLAYGARLVPVELRCNVVPTGKNGVTSFSIRFQSQQTTDFYLDKIGLFDSQQKLVEANLTYSVDGLIIICGRVNCGKNTTLIALVNKLKELHPDKRILLIEDPIEQLLTGVEQWQIDNTDMERGYKYYLSAALRHDPDIIGVGEIRDSDSAKLVLDAAAAGHTTISTLHASDTAKAIERFNSLVHDSSRLADSLKMIISQKLVKKCCKNCVKIVDDTAPHVPKMEQYIAKIGWKNDVVFTRSSGKTADGSLCRHCNGTGFYGRMGIFEILTLSEKMRDLIIQNAPIYELRKLSIKEGLRSLWLNGLTRVLLGETTLVELLKKCDMPNWEKEMSGGLSYKDDFDEIANQLN